MSTSASPIAISYSGPPVKVDGRRVTREMFVPNLGRNDPLQADESPGEVAVALFEQAKAARALVIPDELHADCYGDSDESGGGFILAVYATDGSAGATCRWRDVENIVCPANDPRPDNDRRLVKEALQFMAGELNAALGIRARRSSQS